MQNFVPVYETMRANPRLAGRLALPPQCVLSPQSSVLNPQSSILSPQSSPLGALIVPSHETLQYRPEAPRLQQPSDPSELGEYNPGQGGQ